MAGISWAEAVSSGTNFRIPNGTNFPISNVTSASSGGILGADLHLSNGTNFPISNGTNLISNVTNASSGGVLGADLQHSLLAVTYSAVLLLGLAGSARSPFLLCCRARPLCHSSLLLLQLALLDTLFLAVLPLHIHSLLLGDSWRFGDAACGLTRALFCLHSWLSVAFLCCLCAQLWLGVLHPFASLRLRAAHYVLLATALWLLALAGAVPVVLQGMGGESCSPASWAQPSAPLALLAAVFGVAAPFSMALLGCSVRRSRRGAATRRKALGTILMVLGICALCFVPQQLGQLLQEPLASLAPGLHRVTAALASCSCCLNPLLYHCHSSSRPWRCPCRLRLRPKRVFTICDQNFGDPSWDSRSGWRRGRKIPWGWNQLIQSRYTQS